MTKPTGIGRGGRRAGGRPKGSLNKKTLARLAAIQVDGATLESVLPAKARGRLALPVLHRLVADARTDLGHRLHRLEQTGADNGRRLADVQETLERVLRHQTALATLVGAIEPTAMPRHTRRRPLGT